MNADQVVFWLFVMTLLAGLAIGVYQLISVQRSKRQHSHSTGEHLREHMAERSTPQRP